ncbi:EF-hand domain-containing protein [Lysobacter arvi]|uniref:EF-hand domain-containing protein n=1 Tax=Lysobacter arvi TaxID=3038776 RepID=A0ABU1CIB7_9GAMM|nr:EF-hand domain-containing protein [Lysobacter arvi]MDR0184679.1 EF-hand domain-containing protein [Lysobacter arvi]
MKPDIRSNKRLALWIGALLLAPAAAMAGDDKAKMMDTDGDGMVSSAEHAAGAKTMFTRMDANSDGKVTAAEMDAHHAAKMAGKGDKMKMSSADKIKKIDTDGDGAITAAEHDAGSAQMFTKMDTNGDGNLTAAEMKAGHDKEMRSAKSGP